MRPSPRPLPKYPNLMALVSGGGIKGSPKKNAHFFTSKVRQRAECSRSATRAGSGQRGSESPNLRWEEKKSRPDFGVSSGSFCKGVPAIFRVDFRATFWSILRAVSGFFRVASGSIRVPPTSSYFGISVTSLIFTGSIRAPPTSSYFGDHHRIFDFYRLHPCSTSVIVFRGSAPHL